MRTVTLATALVLAALPCIAQEPEEPPSVEGQEAIATAVEEGEPQSEGTTERRFTLDLESAFEGQGGVLDPAEVLRIDSDREYRAMMWQDPMVRARYNMMAETSMLGRGGLVHGGRMVGVGLAPTVIGDFRHSGTQFRLDGNSWSELSRREKIETGFQVTVGTGILLAIFGGL